MDIVQEAKNLALKEIRKFGIPNLVHFRISEKKALELAEKLNANKTITLVGVYLMDVKLGEAVANGKMDKHVEMGVEVTKKFLEKFNLDKETEKKIINCVGAHHGQVPFICIEAEIVANADCYRFLHPKGFFASLVFIGRKFSFEDTLNFLDRKLDEKYKILSLDICKKELEKFYHQFKEFIRIAKLEF